MGREGTGRAGSPRHWGRAVLSCFGLSLALVAQAGGRGIPGCLEEICVCLQRWELEQGVLAAQSQAAEAAGQYNPHPDTVSSLKS